jgi:hypothetical protein
MSRPRHSSGEVRDSSGTGRHGIVSDAVALLRTEGKTPESVAGFLRQAAETVPAPRGTGDARQATS